MKNPFRNRVVRTPFQFAAGLLLSYVVALYAVPRWPGFCDNAIVARPCEAVDFLTGFGYATIVLGIIMMVLGPVISSLLDLAINGNNWETPRGTETITSNMPILLGALYLGLGLFVVIIA